MTDERLVKAFKRVLIGGNSLASAVISAGMLGIGRDIDPETAWQKCGELPVWDREKQQYIAYEMWVCWKEAMNARDSVSDLIDPVEATV